MESLLFQEPGHLPPPVGVEMGPGVEVSDEHFFPNATDRDYSIERSAFFVVEPGLELEVNVTRVLRMAIGGSYRMVRGRDLSTVSDNDLSNWAGNFSLRFGGFSKDSLSNRETSKSGITSKAFL